MAATLVVADFAVADATWRAGPNTARHHISLYLVRFLELFLRQAEDGKRESINNMDDLNMGMRNTAYISNKWRVHARAQGVLPHQKSERNMFTHAFRSCL